MPLTVSRSICSILCIFWAFADSVYADEAASNYLFAALELGGPVPDYVASATTDDPDKGFAILLSDKQVSYLEQRSVASALNRFDDATSCSECVWSRYSQSSWSDAHLNDRLHRLARVALLRARVHYEAGRWIEGNRSVERVRVMARHMTLQARPFEHQCFMIENMANGTAAAYILQLPQGALADLFERHHRLGVFSPKAGMLTAEADRMRVLAEDFEGGQVAVDKLLEFVDPYLATAEDEQRVRRTSRKDAADELRGLSSFLNDHSQLMELGHNDAEQQIAKVYRRHSQMCRLVADFGEPWFGDYRENAQGICRGIMIGAVINRLRSGELDFTRIKDPYSSNSFKFQKNDSGFTLVSELQHHSRINFRFGLAGPD